MLAAAAVHTAPVEAKALCSLGGGPITRRATKFIASDGIMKQLAGAPRTKPEWTWDNPKSAVTEFLARHPEFKPAPQPQPFNEGMISRPVTYWPDGYLRRIK